MDMSWPDVAALVAFLAFFAFMGWLNEQDRDL